LHAPVGLTFGPTSTTRAGGGLSISSAHMLTEKNSE
jgi:hypothetical protein